jgi:hypothetical protein
MTRVGAWEYPKLGKSSPSAPAAPDPVATANAQSAANAETARVQARLNRVNQTTPYGSISYTNDGDQYTQNTSYTPVGQQLVDQTQRAQLTYADIGNNQLDAVRGSLSQPVNTDYTQQRQSALDAQKARLDPTFRMQEEDMRSRLLNQGLTEGSNAWDTAYRQFNQGRNDAYLQADLNAGNTVGQQIQQTAALRSIPLNETSALLSGQQVQGPQMTNVAQTQVAPTDYLGAQNMAYQGQMNAYGQQQQNQQANMGGLYGLGSAAIMGGIIL